ncbi:hypothetical protein COCC4DRAFT_205759 [Bipolaris maydis ATCC 48331]|uniref:Uncharacterized protein n=2 Tax=Cochliobolus heterostrophus TaxID=5016 RepID=M2V9Y5_COCH5|nr:uncharacterized protein COCC4DRAFT_205759 [Bipolaris maydis ATCC 48331]EMD96518.1 hypothetical protein COCHEDRAFT_1162276 [Bipolaris maydis C5]KAJ5031590.1 ubiquitin 3 binding protein But2 C-terminal domain-containing protein [Bipolaris maydis]ENI00654.1 hypothetical protein COCC4DRAFT_205759 [Bipolaris maydis ATCC 48331]KAJ5060365.1 ubiquitin 3 binding protein But2 C-terminal domain-containing protein [Bipolaris maydis]KAJ6201802.1 ubiquitin 3 binding protein But2 C-terminal domain-contain
MRYAFVPLALGLGANALVARSGTQCYTLKASGGAQGVLGQLGDGQNRVGDKLPNGCYCLSNGGFTDSNGRGCILTPPTTQFQCDVGASPTSGFAVGSDGSVTYSGSATFYACPVNDNGVYNVYSQPVANQAKCVKISLAAAGSCGTSSTPPPPKPSPSPSPQPSHPSAPADVCPLDLNGAYQFPHLIVPVNADHPDTAYGTQYNAKADSRTCTIFNFDIPYSYAGKKCSTIFLFPKKQDLQTSDYTISGSGHVSVSRLAGPATQGTTWNNRPKDSGASTWFDLTPGTEWYVESQDCAAGQTIAYEMCAEGSFAVEYFQDYNPSPIGLYVREC